MPLNKTVGIRPGYGNKANEFEELDREDREIAEALEAKAQAGVPPGADHPGIPGRTLVSHHDKAVKRSKEKAKLDLLFGEAREKFIAEMEAKRASGQLAAEEEAADEAAEAAAALPVGADIPVPASELAWFIGRFRLKRWVRDHTATLAELQPVPKDGGLRELQAIYYAKPELASLSDLDRRHAIEMHLDAYRMALADGKRPPKGMVIAPLTPRLHPLTPHQLLEVKVLVRLDNAEGHHANYSHSFLRLRDYLLFVAVFFAYVYCGRSDKAHWVKKGLHTQFKGFNAVNDTAQYFDYLQEDFLDAFFPTEHPGSGAVLNCQAQQFLSDGVNLRVGNARVRQVRVGRIPSSSTQWQASDVPQYATCDIPALFADAFSSGDQGCFREWGYKENGIGAPNEFTLPFRGVEWQNHIELNTPGYYSVQTRAQLPGSGYVKDLANSKSEALVDLEALEHFSWIDPQTRAVFVEFTVLNVPTGFLSRVAMVLQTSAEGQLSTDLFVQVSGLYRYARLVATAWNSFFSDVGTLAAGVAVGLIMAGISAYVCTKTLRLKSKVTTGVIVAGLGLIGTWWGMAMAYGGINAVDAAPYMWPGLDALLTVCIVTQVISEVLAVRRAVKHGDSALHYIFGDPYNAVQLLNLLSFSAAIVIRASSLFLFYEEGLPALESSLQAPCYGTDVSAQSSTSSSSSSLSDVLVAAWSSVPTGCWGVATTVPDDAYASDDALATAWEASSYSDTYGAGDTYVDYGNCGAASTSQDRVSSSCCAEVRTLPLLWAIDLDAWVDQLVAMSALLLCLRFFKYVRMFTSLSLFSETLREAMRRVGHIFIIISIIMTGFAVAFHLAFGFADSKYRDFPESVKTLFEMLLGNMDLATLRAINPYLAPLFFYLYLTVMVMVVLSIFVAVVNSAYEDTRETLAMPEYCFARDDLWCYCNNVDDLAPCQGPGQLWQALKLSKDFQRNPSVYALSDKDRERLSSVMRIADKLSRGDDGPPDIGIEGDNSLVGEGGGVEGGEGAGEEGAISKNNGRGSSGNKSDANIPPVNFELRQPDGKTDLGATTGLYVRNTPMFRARLAAARGTDRQEMVDDVVHCYWLIRQLIPVKSIRDSLPSELTMLKWLEPALDDSVDESSNSSGDGGIGGSENGDGEGEGVGIDGGPLTTTTGAHDKDPQSLAAAAEASMRDDSALQKAGLNPTEISYLRKLETPKLSMLKDLVRLEREQRHMLAAIDGLGKKSRDCNDAWARLLERRSAAAEKQARADAVRAANDAERAERAAALGEGPAGTKKLALGRKR